MDTIIREVARVIATREIQNRYKYLNKEVEIVEEDIDFYVPVAKKFIKELFDGGVALVVPRVPTEEMRMRACELDCILPECHKNLICKNVDFRSKLMDETWEYMTYPIVKEFQDE